MAGAVDDSTINIVVVIIIIIIIISTWESRNKIPKRSHSIFKNDKFATYNNVTR